MRLTDQQLAARLKGLADGIDGERHAMLRGRPYDFQAVSRELRALSKKLDHGEPVQHVWATTGARRCMACKLPHGAPEPCRGRLAGSKQPSTVDINEGAGRPDGRW